MPPAIPDFPKRLLFILLFLVIGSYLISFATTWGAYEFQTMLLVVVWWYAFWALDALIVVLQYPDSGWPRRIGGLLAVIMVLALAATFPAAMRPAWWIQVIMALGIVPAAVYAFTGRYLLMPPPPR